MRPIAVVATILGVLLVGVAALYLLMPPGALPSFLPGYQPGVIMGHHTKNGMRALMLALAFFTFAWFQKSPRKR